MRYRQLLIREKVRALPLARDTPLLAKFNANATGMKQYVTLPYRKISGAPVRRNID
jgi:hypothetical protein